jgi:hypothetical protein
MTRYRARADATRGVAPRLRLARGDSRSASPATPGRGRRSLTRNTGLVRGTARPAASVGARGLSATCFALRARALLRLRRIRPRTPPMPPALALVVPGARRTGELFLERDTRRRILASVAHFRGTLGTSSALPETPSPYRPLRGARLPARKGQRHFCQQATQGKGSPRKARGQGNQAPATARDKDKRPRGGSW